MKELYEKLRGLISDKFKITISDSEPNGEATVLVSPCKGDGFPWTHFDGKNIEHALERAIHKLENPDEDYVALDGHVWKATESSIFDAEHIRNFLKKGGTTK